jgi:hypothetical protein
MSCPKCKESARFVGYRVKTFVSLLGPIIIDRGYYHCKQCRECLYPRDSILRLSSERLTPAAVEATTLMGIQESFGQVAKRTLYKLTGLKLCESTVERTTEAAGQRLNELFKSGKLLGEPDPWEWNRDATGQSCGYVSVDATGIMMQGPEASKVDGRMVNVGMVFNPQPRSAAEEAVSKPCDDVRYQAGLFGLDELGDRLRQQAAQVGLDQVDQWIALSDAGQGLERFFDVYFPRAAKIVDFRHATEHLTPLTKLLKPGEAGEALLSNWCHQLKHEGGAAVLAILSQLDRASMDGDTLKAHDGALTYYRNHSARMNYPEYLRRGWQIGTGAVESACKRLINQRLNMGGMRWSEHGGSAVANLRALFFSDAEQWDCFWSLAA